MRPRLSVFEVLKYPLNISKQPVSCLAAFSSANTDPTSEFSEGVRLLQRMARF